MSSKVTIFAVIMLMCAIQSLACGKVKREEPRGLLGGAELESKENRNFIDDFKLLCSLANSPGVDIFMKGVDRIKGDKGKGEKGEDRPSDLLNVIYKRVTKN